MDSPSHCASRPEADTRVCYGEPVEVLCQAADGSGTASFGTAALFLVEDIEGGYFDKLRATLATLELTPGEHTVAIAPETFEEPFSGVEWLGPGLITPAGMIAYIWGWGGFAMVNSFGLASKPWA